MTRDTTHCTMSQKGGQKELCENSKIKDLELIFTWIHIRKHEKDMSSQIK